MKTDGNFESSDLCIVDGILLTSWTLQMSLRHWKSAYNRGVVYTVHHFLSSKILHNKKNQKVLKSGEYNVR